MFVIHWKVHWKELALVSFPVPRPAFRRLPYCKRQKAGRGTGYEAKLALLSAWLSNMM